MTATTKARRVHALRARGGKYTVGVAVCGATIGRSGVVVGFPENGLAPVEATCPRCRAGLASGADFLRGPADLRTLTR